MAGMWEERAIEFRRMWEEALRWERAARAREERAEKLALEREEEARRREAVWEARARLEFGRRGHTEQDIRYLKWSESLLCWTSLSKENCALKLDIHSQTSSHTTLSNENQSLELCLDQAGREKEMLKLQVTELDTTVLSIQGAYNELFCLEEKLILDNDTMDKELQELRSYQNLLQEDEFTQEDNTSSDLEELEESNNRSKAMEEILDNVECQLNTLPSQKKPKKKRKMQQRRDSCGRYCEEHTGRRMH